MKWLHKWWECHWQKSWAAVLMLIDGVNLTALQLYQQDIVQFFGPQRGPTIFSGLRIGLGALIYWRATKRKDPSMPPPDPQATR